MSPSKTSPTEPTWKSSLGKALAPGSEWPDKDELLDVVYWGKQVLSLFVGLIFGFTPMTGILGIISYVVISSVVAQHYVTKFQKVDEDDVGGFWELSKEGFGAAFATYMVTWITQRVSERRIKILKECEAEKLSCSVFDALNGFSSTDEPLQGMWTLTPVILKLPNVSDWTIVSEDTSEIGVKYLKRYSNSDKSIFSGFGLKDKEATIIHHFGMNTPDNFQYPLLSAGFILSRVAIERIRKAREDDRWNGFAIDASYEFALLLYKRLSLRLTHDPSVFCCGNHSVSDGCLVRCSVPQPTSATLRDTDIQVMIKTYTGYHQSRLPVLRDTWTARIPRVEYCSDKRDEQIPTIDLGVANTDRGHCGKTWAIFKRFLEKPGDGTKWLLIADDDTLMSWKRLKNVLEAFDPKDSIIIGERYGFGLSVNGQTGYDYPTGGSGMIFSRSAVRYLLETCPACAADNDPDDMTIGICAIQSGIPIVHEPGLHQARPQDYARECLQYPISFHKFTDIDPRHVYRTYLADDEESEIDIRSEL
ncbi:unnamed protein product [Caenorhabditis sp. 36 PRJEB53466]|nr:unnamed protein product [Caenorhabditis sp. 36 PRJEB53466]